MGENIGTTVTSNIAALTGNAQARRAAFAHFIFNTFGVIWVLCVFHPFVDMVRGLVRWMAPDASPHIAITYALSAFHTRVVASNMGVRRLDLLSSGPKTRKFLASSFSRITSRIKVPSTSMSWASTAPGAGRSMP